MDNKYHNTARIIWRVKPTKPETFLNIIYNYVPLLWCETNPQLLLSISNAFSHTFIILYNPPQFLPDRDEILTMHDFRPWFVSVYHLKALDWFLQNQIGVHEPPYVKGDGQTDKQTGGQAQPHIPPFHGREIIDINKIVPLYSQKVLSFNL